MDDLRQRILATLREHPEGMLYRDIRAVLGSAERETRAVLLDLRSADQVKFRCRRWEAAPERPTTERRCRCCGRKFRPQYVGEWYCGRGCRTWATGHDHPMAM